jgi:hypothetical protein
MSNILADARAAIAAIFRIEQTVGEIVDIVKALQQKPPTTPPPTIIP